jgi:pimeloyl-ACP methyl ester carboxylesterase
MKNLVLLPGFMLNTHLWDDMHEDLSALGNLHFGDLGQDASIDAMAERVLQHAPDTFYLFGFSMGGFVAQAIALKAPERVLGLALLNTSSRPQTAAEASATLAQIALAENIPFKGLTSRALMSAVHPDRRHEQALIGRLQAMALDNGKAVFLRQLATLRDGSHADIERITCPVLIVTSDADQLRTVAESEEMAQRIGHAELKIITGSGHMTPIEVPHVLSGMIAEWINKHAS